MNKKKLDHIWNHIEEDLAIDYQELNKEFLYQAIQQLPTYQAPDRCWAVIDQELGKSKKFSVYTYLKMAAVVIVLLAIGVLIQYNLGTKVATQYAKVYDQSIDLYQISDTTHDVFVKLKNSTCTIKPEFCNSEEFKQFELTYNELEQMQQKILAKSADYDNADQFEIMLLKIETQKKDIQQELIQQLNKS